MDQDREETSWKGGWGRRDSQVRNPILLVLDLERDLVPEPCGLLFRTLNSKLKPLFDDLSDTLHDFFIHIEAALPTAGG